jgi:uncharacterized protein YwqG
MAANNDLSTLRDAELVQALVDNIKFHDTLEHIGRKHRLMDRRWRILKELEARDGTLQPLRRLLGHSDPSVRLSAAFAFRKVDRPTCELILSDLAKRDDETGWHARQCLEWGLRNHDEGEPESKEKISSEPSPFDWQSDNPPPKNMTLAEVKHLLEDEFPADRAERLLCLARPAIGLWPQRPGPDLAASASRLGGMPHAPRGWSWPLCEAEPMLFLGQINCADLWGLLGSEELPSSGLLAFFGDHDAVMSGTRYRERPVAVYYWAQIDHLVPAVPPLELQIVFPLCGLAFYPLIDLPDPFSRAVESVLPEEDQDWDYHAVWEAVREHGLPSRISSHCAFSKVFGWPRLEQGDLDCIGDPSDPNGFRLFLQIDSYSNGTESAEWGDHGALYFLIRDDDLRMGRFDRCEFDMQCG